LDLGLLDTVSRECRRSCSGRIAAAECSRGFEPTEGIKSEVMSRSDRMSCTSYGPTGKWRRPPIEHPVKEPIGCPGVPKPLRARRRRSKGCCGCDVMLREDLLQGLASARPMLICAGVWRDGQRCRSLWRRDANPSHFRISREWPNSARHTARYVAIVCSPFPIYFGRAGEICAP